VQCYEALPIVTKLGAPKECKDGEIVAKTPLEKEEIVETIRSMPRSSFTVLEFIEVFRSSYPEDWDRLVERFGQFGEKRRYTVTTYLSNRLDFYSRQPGPLLLPLIRFGEDKIKDYRKTTTEEVKRFGRPWISVYKKKGQGAGQGVRDACGRRW
jgi:hypothetical protein